MTDEPAAAGGRAGPAAPGDFRGRRALQVAMRTVHVAAMAFVLGAVAFRGDASALDWAWTWAALSGVAMLWLDLLKGDGYFTQGNGAAVLLKLLLLAVGQWLAPGARLGWFLAATAVASVGSHMPKTWRHWSLIERRVIER